MISQIPVVVVVGQNGEPLRINESAYDPKIHKLWKKDDQTRPRSRQKKAAK
jgi:hypothetical protein